jgi:hypothetical protein
MSAASRPAAVTLICVLALACSWMVAPAPAPASALGLGGTGLGGTGLGGTGLGGTGLGGAGLGGAGLGGAAQTVVSSTSTAVEAATAAWVLGSAQGLLDDTATALSDTTAPQLRTTWFSSTYWRMAAIAAVLTMPFLFAAAVQAVIRSDLALLARAAFGFLPLAMLGIAIAAPLTMLLLAASDQMSGFISSAAGNASAHFLAKAGAAIGALATAAGSPFLALLVGLFMIGAAFALWIELLMREAAVYVIVLMLPLAFAAMVWPARRIWAVRAVELLVALILSKFAIVAVLSLGGAALSSGADDGSVGTVMTGAVLILLAAFSPWALLRLIPLAELATGAAGTLRSEVGRATPVAAAARVTADEWSAIATAAMRRDARPGGADPGSPARRDPDPADGVADAPDDGGEGPASDGGGGEGPASDGGGGEASASNGAGGEGPPGDVESVDDLEDVQRQPALELGANGLGTPAWPHEDAS